MLQLSSCSTLNNIPKEKPTSKAQQGVQRLIAL